MAGGVTGTYFSFQSFLHSHIRVYNNTYRHNAIKYVRLPIHIMRYIMHIHCSGKGCRKLNKGNLQSFGSPHFISASAKPLSSRMSKTILKPAIEIRRTSDFK